MGAVFWSPAELSQAPWQNIPGNTAALLNPTTL